MKKYKFYILAAVLLVGGAVGVWFWMKSGDKDDPQTKELKEAAETVTKPAPVKTA